MRRLMLPLAIVVAIVAIAVPTCRMVGCDMGAMGAMPLVPHNGPHVSEMCLGQWEFSSTPNGVVPSGSDPLVMTLFAALAAVIVLAPQRAARYEFAHVSNAPPPPQDPLGERFRV